MRNKYLVSKDVDNNATLNKFYINKIIYFSQYHCKREQYGHCKIDVPVTLNDHLIFYIFVFKVIRNPDANY